MPELLAFVRLGFLSAASYRFNMVLSLIGLGAVTIPIYFIAHAIHPVVADSIVGQGGHYFAFLLLGLVAYQFVTVAVDAIPGAIGSGIRNGTLEALFTTPVRLPLLLTGMMTYGVLWQVTRSLVYLTAGSILGAQFLAHQVAVAIGIVALIMMSYVAVGLFAGALILIFRTSGPLKNVVLAGSALLGGVYYPTEVIPSWIQHVSSVLPLTYGLRALRRTFLEDVSLDAVAGDIGILAGMSAVLLLVSGYAFARSLRYARHAGTLCQY